MKKPVLALSVASLWVTAICASCGSGSSGSSGSAVNAGDADGSSIFDGSTGTGSTEPDSGAPDSQGGKVHACAGVAAQPFGVRANLIVLFDRSASMGVVHEADGGTVDNTATRWQPVTQAMKTFFADPKSTRLSASLQYFPLSGSSECNSAVYTSPAVPLTSLPSNAFASSLDTTTPTGGTPTVPALNGTVQFAKSKAAGDMTVILLVTDGQPTDCSSTIDEVSAIAHQAYTGTPSIATYVIGVGPDTGALDNIASAGGTTKAIYAPAGSNGQQTTSSLVTQLDSIRDHLGSNVASCSVYIPRPPSGETLDLDPSGVDVTLTPSAGSPAKLSYNAACTGDRGWHYDNATIPKVVELCASSCNDFRNDRGAQLSLFFDCTTE
ncbi:MAG TPA: vWA domain-containing protein [Polyangiaceae bacterium]|nr:vWA domain-containing protein [Polyangiaceae bacterium]